MTNNKETTLSININNTENAAAQIMEKRAFHIYQKSI